MLLPLLDKFPFLPGRVGRPRTKPLLVTADRAYHSRARADALHARGVWPLLPARGHGTNRGPGRLRWPVERSMAWLTSSSGGCGRGTSDGWISMKRFSNWPAASSAGET
jgi:hypothetical protein